MPNLRKRRRDALRRQDIRGREGERLRVLSYGDEVDLLLYEPRTARPAARIFLTARERLRLARRLFPALFRAPFVVVPRRGP